jgi:hypothetical protein
LHRQPPLFRCLWCPNFQLRQFTLSSIVLGVCGLSVVLKVLIISIYTTSNRFHPVFGRFQVSVVCLWCPKFKLCQFTLPPIVSTLSVVVFRCLWFVCGLSVVTKLQIMSIYTSSYRFHPVCGRFQGSVVCLWSVCSVQSTKYDNLHYLLLFPPCLWSFSGVFGLSVVPKVQNMTIYTTSYRFHTVCGRFQVSVVCLWSVCGAQSSNSVKLHFFLSFPPCLWSFLGVCGLSVVPKLQILSIYTSSFCFHPV